MEMGKRMKKRKRMVLTVTLDCPDGADLESVEYYVGRAVASFSGSLDPLDPMFNLDPNSVDTKFYRWRETR